MAIIARDHADTCLHRCGRHSILMLKFEHMVTEKLNLGWFPEMVNYAVHRAPHTIYHLIYQSLVNSLITVNVIKEDNTFGRTIAKR